MSGIRLQQALDLIDGAHSLDPNKIMVDGQVIPYELHYARKMTTFLARREPKAPEMLQLAIRAQHFRRWEVPRDSYPRTRVGYHAWRNAQKKRQAELLAQILLQCGYADDEVNSAMALVEKKGLKDGDVDTQILEDVACLVFLDDQFEEFERGMDEEKMVEILRKTWAKMSLDGRSLALEIPMASKCSELVQRAMSC